MVRRTPDPGPASARNASAAATNIPIFVFVDADVEIRVGALSRIRRHFVAHPELAAVFGSYDDDPEECVGRSSSAICCTT